MSINQLRQGFYLYKKLVIANKVRLEKVREQSSFIIQLQLRLGDERNSLQLEFDSQALLIYRFSKSASLLFVYLEQAPIIR